MAMSGNHNKFDVEPQKQSEAGVLGRITVPDGVCPLPTDNLEGLRRIDEEREMDDASGRHFDVVNLSGDGQVAVSELNDSCSRSPLLLIETIDVGQEADCASTRKAEPVPAALRNALPEELAVEETSFVDSRDIDRLLPADSTPSFELQLLSGSKATNNGSVAKKHGHKHANILKPKAAKKKAAHQKQLGANGFQYELFEDEAVNFSDKVQTRKVTAEEESSWIIALQVFVPFLIAGLGTVGAGLVLDSVQHWRVFTEVSEIFILVPALLGLKGNLEMTLASRLSTLANLGCLDNRADTLKHVTGNLALIQAQAAVVAFLASIFAIILGWIPKGEFVFGHAVLLCAGSLATASFASLILSAVMIAVVLLSRRLNINPDNVATPIAASLGDLTTLGLLATIGTFLNKAKVEITWLAPAIIAVFILLIPLWVWITLKNPHTKAVLEDGWSPVIFSMLISSAGGFILDITVVKFHGIAVFQPVINGIGGNLVAVQASRISTSLHRVSQLGRLPNCAPSNCPNPFSSFCSHHIHSRASRVLLSLVVPGHLIFISLIYFLKAGHTAVSPTFVVVYLLAALLQVSVLLYICMWMVHFMWKRSIDPDNSAIPYLTALGDLIGTALLALAFAFLAAVSKDVLNE